MKTTITILCLILSAQLFGQSKKDLKKYRVKNITEIIVDVSGGKETKRTDVQKKLDDNGNVIEEINFDKKGNIQTKTLNKYNSEKDKVEEIVQDANGKQISREVYKYDINGEKKEEWKYNELNTLEAKQIYTIDSKGFRTERKTIDAQGKTIQIKKYIYGN
ncbi:hypothetical protein VB264_21910 [Arcicella aquatica]|uniref:YD repeat-containing protein n=1 Tax=Arcicella aquatica TaxID=217141 RepID=A0ABU5QTP8_9BACT|nr:hypothetical protein [Arcicella aquatica]MEA5260468.1 hypothetical protein [Arcicella aquatica]